MEPEGSLSHSQAPTTCPYPEPAQSSPQTHIPLPEDPFSTTTSEHKWRDGLVGWRSHSLLSDSEHGDKNYLFFQKTIHLRLISK
jgi:hypothetical protein